MVKVGITGGIGSGKTTVCNVWESIGAYVLNADDLAKIIMTSDRDVIKQIRDTFGEESYHPDGSLNRDFLAEQAFANGRVRELNNIVHPHIPEQVEKLMEEARQKGYDVFVYEAALLLQNLRPQNLDYVVIVLADRQKRIQRVTKRDDVEKQGVIDRIDNQQNFEQLLDQSDIIIRNNSTRKELENRAREVYRLFWDSGE